MKKIILAIFFFFLIQILSANKDSTKIKKFRGFYATCYYPYSGGYDYRTRDRYSDDSELKYEEKDFSVRTPNRGFGYILNKHPFFIRTDVSYSYGSKKLNDKFGGNSEDINGGIGENQYNNMSIYFSNGDMVGKRYYKYSDEIKGRIDLHYLDINMALGGNVVPWFRPYMGWRLTLLMDEKYRATQQRTASLYEIKAYTSQSSTRDSLIETTNLEYKDERVKSLSNQFLSHNIYTSFGFCSNFKIAKQLFFAELQYDYNAIFLFRFDLQRNYFLFRLGYVFNYSTYFGKKKLRN